MNANKGLTRVDAIIAVACVALVLVHAGVINAGGRERSKREVCMANLRMLTAAWQMYADDNGGKIVNGGQAPEPTDPAIIAKAEPYWYSGWPNAAIGLPDWDWNGATYAKRIEQMKRGALYKYCPDVAVFRCTEAAKTTHRSYVMPNSMNAWWNWGGYPKDKVAKNTGQIARPNERIVFLEEKWLSPNAFEFPYPMTEGLCDRLAIMHGNGANFGFADGHADYHRYECQSTIAWALGGPSPAGEPCFQTKDRVWLRNALWGD